VSEWQPIETAPKDKQVMLWWRPKSPNRHAEAVVIGQISSWEEGKWWNSQRGEYQGIWHITHWRPVPEAPADAGTHRLPLPEPPKGALTHE